LKLGHGKALNGSFDVGLLEFWLIMQISEEINAVYDQNSRWVWTRFWSHPLHVKTRVIYVDFKFRTWSF
jgi:hypothetical protein